MRLQHATDEQLQHILDDALHTNDDTLAEQVQDECDRRDRYTPPPPTSGATLHSAALWYAMVGLSVFPLKPLSKQPATRHGFKDATIDADQINQWWASNPQYNIGLATGLLFDVADLDGWEAVDHWACLDDRPESLGVVITPRPEGGGRHVYVPLTGQGNSTNLLPKVDWRGLGGYVVAPPSRLEHGPYYWHRPLDVEAL